MQQSCEPRANVRGEATGEKKGPRTVTGLISGGIMGKFRERFAFTVAKSRGGLAVSFTLRKSRLWLKVAARVEPFGSASNFFRNPQLVKVEPKGP
jgi:hypothetical protein